MDEALEKVLVFGVCCRVPLLYGLEQAPLRVHTREVIESGTGLGTGICRLDLRGPA